MDHIERNTADVGKWYHPKDNEANKEHVADGRNASYDEKATTRNDKDWKRPLNTKDRNWSKFMDANKWWINEKYAEIEKQRAWTAK